MHVPEGSFKFKVGYKNFEPVLKEFGGPNILTEWNNLLNILQPIQELSTAIPPLVLRSDVGLFFTLWPHLGKLLKGAPIASKVEGSFKAISGQVVKDSFLVSYFGKYYLT